MIAIGFASVSALVMLLRQMMGGSLSRLDIHLITSYLSGAFSAALAAILPVLFSSATGSPAVLWAVCGVIGAGGMGWHLAAMILRRRRITGVRAPTTIVVDWVLQAAGVLTVAVNIFWPRLAWVYGAAVTLVLAMVMLAFIRRVASLLSSEQRPHDWDMRKG